MREMLGKRHRPLPRTTSKLQIIPDGNLLHFPVIEYLSGTPKHSATYFEPQRQVIGFNPIPKETDTKGSPLPVLSGIGGACLQEKPLSSPRSGLQGLSSGSRAWEKKRNGCGGVDILADASAREENAASNQTFKSLMVPNGFAVQSADSSNQQRSSQEIQPVPISVDNFGNIRCGKNGQDGVDHCQDNDMRESFPWMSAGSRGRSNHRAHMPPPVHCTTVDLEMGLQGSIFSTSPTSSCNDISGLFPAIDFLSYCYFCNRQLRPGRDIYMYRGDKAFCSVECRYQQIAIDESKEKCSAAALKSGPGVSSVCA